MTLDDDTVREWRDAAYRPGEWIGTWRTDHARIVTLCDALLEAWAERDRLAGVTSNPQPPLETP